jgi:hypothetical protein
VFGSTKCGLLARLQFHHIIDVVPTILEAAGITAPDTVNGIKQNPIEGLSMAYTWDKANANVPSRRDTQYFEMLGNRAIYHDGWSEVNSNCRYRFAKSQDDSIRLSFATSRRTATSLVVVRTEDLRSIDSTDDGCQFEARSKKPTGFRRSTETRSKSNALGIVFTEPGSEPVPLCKRWTYSVLRF